MKKIIALLLGLILLLGCAAGGAEEAEKAEKKIYGSLRVNGDFTLKGIVPEGYEIIPFELSDDAYISRFINDDPARPQMILSVAFDETYGDVEKLNDLDDDAQTCGRNIVKVIAVDLHFPDIAGCALLLICL